MRQQIPAPVVALVAEFAADNETHATLDGLFMHAEAPGEPPEGSKHTKALEWLRRTNRDGPVDPLRVLGRIVEGWMETEPKPSFYGAAPDTIPRFRERFVCKLAEYGLQYVRGGRISSGGALPSRTLQELIRERDMVAIAEEFDRALKNVVETPREAVSAAGNILESLCRIYIEDEGLEMPRKQDLGNLWDTVRKDFGLDPSKVEDQDLKRILSGLLGVVNGIGALRTHASSAHGTGRKPYRLEPRHARLAVHSAHTVATFVLETWDTRRASLD